MRINKKTITTETKSGRTYVPPRIKLCPLDTESIMALTGSKTPYIISKDLGTNVIEGDADFSQGGTISSQSPAMSLETESSTTDVTGLQLFGN